VPERLGFSEPHTKVNRCLTEGRRAFLQRVAWIEGGAECDRLAPLVSLLADGEASAEEVRALRPHLKGCLVCRTRLREYRQAPARVAALVPAAALATHGSGTLRAWLESLVGAAQHKASAFGDRVHSAAELATGQKVAAVAASAAALAGGGAAVDRLGARPHPLPHKPAASVRPVSHAQPLRAAPTTAKPKQAATKTAPSPAASPPQATAPPPPPPDPATEFAPAAAAPPAAPPTTASGASTGGSASGGEFGP
jgi:hypothetical protein